MGKITTFFSGIFNSPKKSIDIIEAPPKEVSVNHSEPKSKIKQFFAKFIGSKRTYDNDRESITSAPEYDFDDIYNASITDSYIKQALQKHKNLIFKAGYQLKSENDKASDYIRQRFKLFSLISQKPMDILFQEIGDDLVTYSNAFIVKARDDNISYPGLKVNGILDDKPVAGYFRLDPRNVYIRTDKHGTIKSYIYKENYKEQKFAPKNMIHFYMDRAAGDKYGTPMVVGALEDVKVLRRIEGIVMTLIYRFAMPIFHWKVGLEESGKGATDAEIDELEQKVSNMAPDGSIVTNERTNVDAIGAETTALDATGYLNYFESRVFTALNVSQSQMGRGGSKQDASSMESQMHDTIKHIQRTISIFAENYMIIELLLEGGFDPIINNDDNVRFVFNEISLETKIKLENHEMAKFQGNMISFSEVRHEVGMKSDGVDLNDFYGNLFATKGAIDQINAKADSEIKVAKATAKLASENNNTNASNTTGASKTVKGNGAQKKSENGSNNTIKSINTPSNQHGTTSVKVKEDLIENNQSIDLIEKSNNKVSSLHKKYDNIYNFYQNIKEAAVINKSDLNFLLSVSFDKLSQDINKIISNQFNAGTNKYFNSTDNNAVISDAKYSHDLASSVTYTLKEIKEDIIKDSKQGTIDIKDVFDKYEYRLNYLMSYITEKSYWYGYVNASEKSGDKRLCIDFHSEEDKKKYGKEIILTNYTLEDIPPFHPYCQCKIKTE